MSIYFISYLLVLTFGTICLLYKHENSGYLALFAWAIYICVASFRAETVGADTRSYVYLVNLLQSNLNVSIVKALHITGMSNGYLWIVKLFNYVSPNYVVNFLFQYGFIFGIMFYYFRKQSVNLLCSLLLFIALTFPHTLNILRQYMMFAFVLLALEFFENKHYIWGILGLVVSIFVHKSAFLFMPAVGLYFIPNKAKYPWLWLAGAIIGCLIVTQTSLFTSLLDMLEYSKYQFTRHADVSSSGGRLALIYLFVCISGLVPLVFSRKQLDEKYVFHLILCYVGTLFMILSHQMMGIMARAGMCYIFFIALLLPRIIKFLFSKRPLQDLVYYALYSILFVTLFISMKDYTYVSYFD